jgi:hypothetical protein
VNIRVAIRAVFADIRENRFCMARNAFHVFMHAAQGIARLAVIEFRNRADGPPTGGSVAIFAGNFERAVWVSRGLFLRVRGMWRESRCFSQGRKKKERPERELE